MRPIIEICLENVESVIAAERGGADRVELCSDLFEGGLSPSIGCIKVAKKLSNISINAMVRPRGGDFCYSDIEFEVMKEEIKAFKREGVNALVFGILTPDGRIDKDRCKELVELSRPLSVTFHRAFDMTRDPFEALDDLIEIGVNRVLTSGQEATAYEGMDTLKKLIDIAGDRIIIMPGCGIKERNFKKIDSFLHAKEYHMSLSSPKETKMTFHPGHIYMGGLLRQSEFLLSETNSERVKNIINIASEK